MGGNLKVDTRIAEDKTNEKSQHVPLTHSSFKPIIIYFFVNPFCHDCWKIEPYIKKLTLEYGRHFTLRPILSHLFDNKSITFDNQIAIDSKDNLNKYYLLIGIKAAALQGNKASYDFLQTMQEALFQDDLTEVDINDILDQCALKASLDINEFYKDLRSSAAKKAYQGDINLSHEMEIDTYPTLVIHSQSVDDYNVKIAGVQPYETYAQLLKDMLPEGIKADEKPNLLDFFKKYGKVQAEEVSFIYDHPIKEVNKGLKELQLQQKVKSISTNSQVYWYSEQRKSTPKT